jgi:hypothetical protein
MNATAARTHRLVESGVLCKTVFDHHGKVKGSVRKKLETYRLPIEAMKEDPFLGDVAKVKIQLLDQTLEYSKNHTEENRVKMFELNEKIQTMLSDMMETDEYKKAMEAYRERR